MIGLGKPIRACHDHMRVLDCPECCLGVELGEPEELQAATHPGCAICQIQPGGSKPAFRILRKCSRHGCYGRFVREPYDDLFVDEYVSAIKRLISRVFGRFHTTEE